MNELIYIPIWHVYQLIKTIKSFNINKNNLNFYSEIPGFVLPMLLSQKCYYLSKSGTINGLLLISGSKNEIYYLPLTSKLTFFDFLYLIYKDMSFTAMNLRIKYKKLNLNLYNKYFRFKIINDIKRMQISLSSDNKRIQHLEDINGIHVRKFELSKDEEIRVRLQNSIFGNQIGREKLTVEEVLNEQTSRRFIEDKCFILERESYPIGYGQVIYYEDTYQLVNFGIVPNEQGKGYGRFFLLKILNDCIESKIKEIHLTVDNSNNQAIGLYEKSGFTEIMNEASIIMKK